MKDSAAVVRLVNTARDPSASLQEQHAAFAELVEQFQHVAALRSVAFGERLAVLSLGGQLVFEALDPLSGRFDVRDECA